MIEKLELFHLDTNLAEDPDYIEPIESELEALEEAKKFLKTCSYREVAIWLSAKTKDTYHMSDLEKELPEIPLPKPKKKVKTKAKQSAKQAIARTRKKVAKAEQSTFSQSSCQKCQG